MLQFQLVSMKYVRTAIVMAVIGRRARFLTLQESGKAVAIDND